MSKQDIFVFADWVGLNGPQLIGVLSAHAGKGKKSFSFAFDREWLQKQKPLFLDPDLTWFSGNQYPANKENFGIFQDSMPDTWGRKLLLRRQAALNNEHKGKQRGLYDIDFLLNVYDESRMGALRYKLDFSGSFLDNSEAQSIPPWSDIRTLQHAAAMLEISDDAEQIDQWLKVLIAPGTSLGGARPKANVLDENGHPWIAKFPAANDIVDKALWEFLAYKLAIEAGVDMAESRVEKVAGNQHTFFTKRFDRLAGERIHFSSAMTLLGYDEALLKNKEASYLEIAEVLQYGGHQVRNQLEQLWRRIVFSIAISNTDDHLRNHGFLLEDGAWILSPAYDLNPSIEKGELSLLIDLESGRLDFDLALSVIEYFQLPHARAEDILNEVKTAVGRWQEIANEMGISRQDQLLMRGAFRI